jgi:hypothetical protein
VPPAIIAVMAETFLLIRCRRRRARRDSCRSAVLRRQTLPQPVARVTHGAVALPDPVGPPGRRRGAGDLVDELLRGQIAVARVSPLAAQVRCGGDRVVLRVVAEESDVHALDRRDQRLDPAPFGAAGAELQDGVVVREKAVVQLGHRDDVGSLEVEREGIALLHRRGGDQRRAVRPGQRQLHLPARDVAYVHPHAAVRAGHGRRAPLSDAQPRASRRQSERGPAGGRGVVAGAGGEHDAEQETGAHRPILASVRHRCRTWRAYPPLAERLMRASAQSD